MAPTKTAPPRSSNALRTPARRPNDAAGAAPTTASTKRRRVDRTPRQVLAHEQEQERQRGAVRAAWGLRGAPVNASVAGGSGGDGGGAGLGAGDASGVLPTPPAPAPAKRPRGRPRKTPIGLKAVNSMATPRDLLRHLAPGLPPPTPDEAADEASPAAGPSAAPTTPAPAAAPRPARLSEPPPPPEPEPQAGPTAAPPASSSSAGTPVRSLPHDPPPAGQNLSDDEDVSRQLLPDLAGAAEASPREPTPADDAIESFERAVRAHPGGPRFNPLTSDNVRAHQRRSRPVISLARAGRISTASGASDGVESQVGRYNGRPSMASTLGLGAVDEDSFEGDLSSRTKAGEYGGAFGPVDDRLFGDHSASLSLSRPSIDLRADLSSPARSTFGGPSLSSMSSPHGDVAPDNSAEIDVDVPEEDDYGLTPHHDDEVASAALGRDKGKRRAVAEKSPEVDMDLGTDEDEGDEPATDTSLTSQAGAPEPAPDRSNDPSGSWDASEASRADMPAGLVIASEEEPMADDEAITEEPSSMRIEIAGEPEDESEVPDFSMVTEPEPDPEDEGEELEVLGDAGFSARPELQAKAAATGAAPGVKRLQRPARLNAAGAPMPELPRAFVKNAFLHFSGAQARLGPGALDAVMDASHAFFAQLAGDAAAFAEHAGRGRRVAEADVEMVMKRTGLVGGPKRGTVQSLGRRLGVPKEVQAVLDGLIEAPGPSARRKR